MDSKRIEIFIIIVPLSILNNVLYLKIYFTLFM